jgi:hypothetical protein
MAVTIGCQWRTRSLIAVTIAPLSRHTSTFASRAPHLSREFACGKALASYAAHAVDHVVEEARMSQQQSPKVKKIVVLRRAWSGV